MFTVRNATSSGDYALYRRKAKDQLGIDYPVAYLRRAKVKMIMYKGQMAGGFVIATKGPFRCLSSLPQHVQHDSPPRSAEINGVFLDHTLSKSATSVLFWLYFAGYLLSSNCDRFYFAYSNRYERLCRFYQRTAIKRVYSGFTRKLEGMTEQDDETIAYITKRDLGMIPLTYRGIIWRRLLTGTQKTLGLRQSA